MPTRIPFLAAESGGNGDAGTTVNTGATSLAATAGSTIIQTTARKQHGALSHKFTSVAASGTDYGSWDLGSTVTALSCSIYFNIEQAIAGADVGIIFIGLGGSQRVNLEIQASTQSLRIRDDASGAKWNGTVTASPTPLVVSSSAFYRADCMFISGATTGQFRVAVYSGDGTTPLSGLDTGLMTSQNLGSDGFSAFRLGAKTSTGTSTGIINFDLDASGFDTSGAYMMGPYQTQLDTPNLTADPDDMIRPTSIGGSDGKHTVSWAAVPGASSYDAYKTTDITPAQGDFTLHAAGVTSPYQFTGLPASGYSLGIKAKA